ncbi:unnamed protein product [Oikopleura dioica]|uniref:Uncharacterized protein n=1 Tax=Oikopleura dioica TaxID=34765 RepID=E4XIJ8_OIKDI|nr:unnamed protein product [Oikopleura dioica]CBY36613.1 unnamed protein product [Oikopleura dioica]CBY37493.1 unnamed protein product [Oikopleura dioica]
MDNDRMWNSVITNLTFISLPVSFCLGHYSRPSINSSVMIGPILSLICAVGNFLALANILGNIWILLFQSIFSLLAFFILVEDIAIQWRTQGLSNMNLGSNGIATFNYEKFDKSPEKTRPKHDTISVEELFSSI